jgi:hypothetical protein
MSVFMELFTATTPMSIMGLVAFGSVSIGLFPSLTVLPAQSGPTFDVASIKLAMAASGKGTPEASVAISGGSLTTRNASLKEMIILAYGLKEHQVTGPGWLDSDRYDVTAQNQPLPLRLSRFG